MKWLYALMARIVAKHHESMAKEISDKTEALRRARFEYNFVTSVKMKTYDYSRSGDKINDMKEDLRNYMRKFYSKLGVQLKVDLNGEEVELSEKILESHFKELDDIHKDISMFCRFIESRCEGSRKIWEEAVTEHEQWFKDHGLPVPPEEGKKKE
jgi:hypothetical protein